MLLLFLHSSGIVHMEFILEGVTVNKHRYKEVLCRLCNSICLKHYELWCRKNCLFLHDNAPAHLSVLVLEDLAEQQVTVLPHPPYSSDLTPCNFFFLSHLKEELHGCRIQSTKEIVNDTREAVRHLPASNFQQCFQQPHQRW
jgi:histone-lysine N-methyltransferase SETMAR